MSAPIRDGWLSQRPQIATEADLQTRWNGSPPGEDFRCYMCGYRFRVGDYWRWQSMNGTPYINFIVCQVCDGPTVKERWARQNEELKTRYWWKRT